MGPVMISHFAQLTPGARIGKNFPAVSAPYAAPVPAGQASDGAVAVAGGLLGLAIQFGIIYGAAYFGAKAAIRRNK